MMAGGRAQGDWKKTSLCLADVGFHGPNDKAPCWGLSDDGEATPTWNQLVNEYAPNFVYNIPFWRRERERENMITSLQSAQYFINNFWLIEQINPILAAHSAHVYLHRASLWCNTPSPSESLTANMKTQHNYDSKRNHYIHTYSVWMELLYKHPWLQVHSKWAIQMHTPTHCLTPQFIHRQTMMQRNANPMYPPTTSIAGWANSYIPQLRKAHDQQNLLPYLSITQGHNTGPEYTSE